MKRFLLGMLLAIPFLAGCSAYHPLKNGIGFTEIPVGEQGFQITYHGGADMSVAQARQYALIRAAELAALRRTPYFHIENERIYLSYGADYRPGNETTFVETIPDRRGRRRVYVDRIYSPGYVDYYAVPEVWLQVRLSADGTGDAIPAGYLLREAEASHVELSPGVKELAAELPATPATIPPAPAAVTKPATLPAGDKLVP